jgi:hypothetical protein
MIVLALIILACILAIVAAVSYVLHSVLRHFVWATLTATAFRTACVAAILHDHLGDPDAWQVVGGWALTFTAVAGLAGVAPAIRRRRQGQPVAAGFEVLPSAGTKPS